MAQKIKPSGIPGIEDKKGVQPIKVQLRNVMFNRSTEDIEVEVVPFDQFNEDHVDFAYKYSDMLFRAPSAFRDISDASKAYAMLFVVHTKESENDPDSKISKVLGDTRACRTLLMRPEIQAALDTFFANA